MSGTAQDRNLHALMRILGGGRADAAGVAAGIAVEDWSAVIALAMQHGVAPLLQRALQSCGALSLLADAHRALLDEERRATALANLRRYGEYRRIAKALGDQGIAVMALKGLHLAELVYRDISLRPMSDMDILVPRAQIRQAVVALYAIEYGFDGEFSGAADAVLKTKYDVELVHRQLDLLLEVHWTLSELPAGQPALLDAIWHDAVPVRLGDAEALVMSPEFLLLHVCAHLACKHVFRFSLRPLCDIAEIVHAYPGLDWSVVIENARRNAWTRGVAAALRLASEHVGAAVPEAVLASLGADALDPGMLAEALLHIADGGSASVGKEMLHATNLLAFAGKGGLTEKLAAIRSRIFISRSELALIHGVPASSARLPIFYAIRIGEVLLRYARSLWALKIADPRLAASAARHARLDRWINQA